MENYVNEDYGYRKNWTVFDHLYASPYGSKAIQARLEEPDFYRNYFVKLDSFKKLQEDIDRYIENSKEATPSFISLYGYAGTGKTTFMHWYLKNHLSGYHKIVFSFIDEKNYNGNTTNREGIPIFDVYFRRIILKLFDAVTVDAMKSLIFQLQSNLCHLPGRFSDSFIRQIADLHEAISDNNVNKYMSIINETIYTDLLLLFLLLYNSITPQIIGPLLKDYFHYIPAENDTKSLFIVFDNIDHMEIEHTNHTFPKRAFDVVTDYLMLTRSIVKKEESDNNLPKIRYMFCLRDANFALVNRQIAEISENKSFPFKPNQLEKVINKRIKISIKSIIDRVREYLLSYFFEKDVEYTEAHFLPLFNFDYRKMIQFIENFTTNGYEQIILHLIQYDEQYKEDRDKYKKHIHRVRGYIYYFIIGHLRKNDYLKTNLLLDDTFIPAEGQLENGKMNAGRILLTIIYNKSRFYYFADDDETEYNIPVPLYDLYVSYKQIFTNDATGGYFFKCLSNLYLCHTENYCHLITFNNKEVFKSIENNFETELEWLREAKQNENFAQTKLNKIELILNPSGYTYLNEIMRHYEFFSIKAGNKKPLFACMSLSWDKKNKEFEPEFITNIRKTYVETEKCVNELKAFIDNYKGGIERFERSDYCFKLWNANENNSADSQPRLYLIRIIDTHIEYIDSLRLYILSTDILKEKYEEVMQGKEEEEGSNAIKQVNGKLIEYLDNYIKLLVGVGTAKKLMDFFNANLTEIRQDPSKSINQNRPR
ncbi:MAG: hypothetical protein LBP64_02730 [Tannerella sp.]|jgi:GTPase SAR1 family protein|nr:hypothetical protein [Tannerella sp.]